MAALLRLKHWQVFLLLYLPYVVVIGMFALSFLETMESPGRLRSFPFISQFAVAVSFTAKFLWQVALAKELQEKLPESQRLHLPFFWTFLILQFLYAISIRIYVVTYMSSQGDHNAFSDFFVAMESPAIGPISASNLLTWICIIYFANVLSKLLTMVETQSDVMFRDYIGSFILLVFFPIGVWFVQPRVNKLFGLEEGELTVTPLDHKLN